MGFIIDTAYCKTVSSVTDIVNNCLRLRLCIKNVTNGNGQTGNEEYVFVALIIGPDTNFNELMVLGTRALNDSDLTKVAVFEMFLQLKVSRWYLCHCALHCISIYTQYLTHWGQMTHINVSKLTIISSHNGMAADRRQAIIWTNAGILLIGPMGTNFSEIVIEIHTFSSKQMHLKMSSAKCRSFCHGLSL